MFMIVRKRTQIRVFFIFIRYFFMCIVVLKKRVKTRKKKNIIRQRALIMKRFCHQLRKSCVGWDIWNER